MNVILENNSFTMDTREARLTRLIILKENIEKFASEISLEIDNLEWSLKAADNFKILLEQQNKEFQYKNDIFKKSNDAENDLYNRYIAIKELILSKSEKNSKIRTDLSLEGSFPANKLKRFEIADATVKYASKNPKELDKIKLPFLLFENLQFLNQKAKKIYEEALISKERTSEITNRVNKEFNEGSVRLREIYNWVVAFWSKKDPKLIELGFTLPSSVAKSDKTPAEVSGFKFKGDQMVWNPLNNADYYQVGWRIFGERHDFNEIYFDKQNKCRIFKKGEYIVRGKNENGFGQWSKKLEL